MENLQVREKRLPVRYELIFVLFSMPGDVEMWWKTKVDSIEIQDTNTIRAIAQVTFDAGSDTSGNYYLAEKGAMHFSHNNTATLLSSHSSFGSGSETTWRHQSEMGDELTNENNSKRARRTTQNNINKDGKHKNRDRGTVTVRRSLRGKKMHSLRYQKKIKSEPTVSDGDVTSDDRIQPQSLNSSVPQIAIAVSNLNTMISSLRTELSALQQKVGSMDKENISKIYSDKTKEKRMYLKHELLRQLKRSLSISSGETNYEFSSAIRRHPYEFSIDCTLKDFASISTDINTQFPDEVQYLPSLPTIACEAQPLCQKHIVFNRCEDLLKWIGIVNNHNQRTIIEQTIKRKGSTILQLLGGVHWDVTNVKRSLHFFWDRVLREHLP